MLAWLRKLFKKKETPLEKYLREHPTPDRYGRNCLRFRYKDKNRKTISGDIFNTNPNPSTEELLSYARSESIISNETFISGGGGDFSGGGGGSSWDSGGDCGSDCSSTD